MNTGAFGEGFPYTNFHDLNMDWIIKIAKDFLDQYTNIQQTISDGNESLDNTLAENILALDNRLTENTQTFNQRANDTAESVIATIPQDYTALSEYVMELLNRFALYSVSNIFRTPILNFAGGTDRGIVYSESNGAISFNGTSTTNSTMILYLGNFPSWLEHDKDYIVNFPSSSNIKFQIYGYPNSSQQSVTTFFDGNGTKIINIPTGIEYLRIRFAVTDNTTVNETVYLNGSEAYSNSELTSMINDIKGLKIVDPDMFNGTDGQKWQSAFNSFGADGQGVIVVNRNYTLTQDIFIDHQTYYDAINNRITVIGLGSGTKLSMGAYEFRGRGTNNVINYGGITWKNINFTGSNWVFRSTNLIRIICENCTFENFKYITYGTTLAQSYYFVNCLFRDINYPLMYLYTETSSSFYDISFRGNLIEHCQKVIDCYRGYNMIFENNCIEALHDLPFKFRGYAQNIVISNNYFEENNSGYNTGDTDNGGINIDLTGLTDAQSITIRENFFGCEDSLGVILLPDTNLVDKGTIIIQGNDCPWEGVFLKSSTTLTDPYSDIYVVGNKGTISDTNNLIYEYDKVRSTVGSTIAVERLGKTIKVNSNATSITGASGWTTIQTLDKIYRPNRDIYFPCVMVRSNTLTSAIGRITTAGALQINISNTNTYTATFDVTYFA